jgi:phage terminase large subunit-like protein
MTPQELVIFGELAGGRSPPLRRVRELIVTAGRRAGKDSIASMLATFAATIEQGHIGRLRPGEMAVVQCLAVDRDQARIVLSYVKAFFDAIPDLKAMVVRETRFGLGLSNGVSIEVTTNNFRQARGRTVMLAILDEAAFYRSDDSATPDFEVYRAVTPSLATLPNSMLIAISSPYRKAGLLYDKWKACFGKPDDEVLVVQASSLQLNPSLDPGVVARARPILRRRWRSGAVSFATTLARSCH